MGTEMKQEKNSYMGGLGVEATKKKKEKREQYDRIRKKESPRQKAFYEEERILGG